MKMRKWIVVLLAGCFISLFAGCQETQAVTPEEYQEYATQMEEWLLIADESKDILVQATAMLEKTGVIDPNLAAKAEKAQVTLEKVLPLMAQMAEKVKNLEYSTTAKENKIIAFLETAQALNGATAAANPYSGLLTIILSLATVIAGIFARKKSVEANTAKIAVEEIVVGNEAVKKSMTADVLDAFKTAQLAAQSTTTQKTVASIRNDMAA